MAATATTTPQSKSMIGIEYAMTIFGHCHNVLNNMLFGLFSAGTTTITPSSEFDSFTLAVLRGRLVRYLMRSREVIATIL